MKTIRFSIVTIFLLMLSGFVFAQAPTITLNVPVQLNDLHPDVALIHVVGNAYNDAGAHIACAEGEVNVQVPAGGDVNQTVSVVLTQKEGMDITKAISYSAAFSIYLKNGNFGSPSPTGSVEYRAKEGTPFTPIVRGPVQF